MANDLTFNQISTILNSVIEQATGRTAIAATNTSEFVSVANTALLTGYDNLMGAISQVLSKTIFSNRPYTAKFKTLQATNQRWGQQVRKLNIIDRDFMDDDRLPLTTTPDMYDPNPGKPEVLQVNFYGQETYQKALTIYKDQLDVAFTSPDDFASFISMCLGNVNNMLESARENLARQTIVNFIAGKIVGDTASTYHVLTLYNAATGQTLDATTILLPENFNAFMRWFRAFINTVSAMMTERSIQYHINVTGKEITRHTPKNKQHLYLYADTLFKTETMVLSDMFNEEYVKWGAREAVNFWQSISTPAQINVTPSYLKPDGSVTTATAAVAQDNLLGVIIDEEAVGYNLFNQWQNTTPLNSRGGYTVTWWHETARYWNDFTENAVVFLLD